MAPTVILAGSAIPAIGPAESLDLYAQKSAKLGEKK
jgi:hypothetical protein